MFGCIRGCSATQSQAEKGRDSIPPIEDEHQQFRPVFSCNPIWRPLSNRISDMGNASSITKHAFGIRTHEVVVFQTSLLGKWVQVSVLQNIASVCACCNKFKYQSSTIQLYIIFKMMSTTHDTKDVVACSGCFAPWTIGLLTNPVFQVISSLKVISSRRRVSFV